MKYNKSYNDVLLENNLPCAIILKQKSVREVAAWHSNIPEKLFVRHS